jgi:hypothetical protein
MAPPAVVPFTPSPSALFTPITKECAELQASINKVVWPRPKTLWREESQKDEEEKKPKERTWTQSGLQWWWENHCQSPRPSWRPD